MPVDPMLNEPAILKALRNEAEPITPNGMRSLMTFVVLAAYDRKVEREFFIGLLDDVAMIGIDLAEMEKAGALRSLFTNQHPDKEPTKINDQVDKICQGFFRKRQMLADKMDLISQCPTLSDKVS